VLISNGLRCLRQFSGRTGLQPARLPGMDPMSWPGCPTSFGFAAAPGLAAWWAVGHPAVRWFCTHSWPGMPQPLSPSNCFSLRAAASGAADPGTAPIRPAMAIRWRSSATRLEWQQATGCADALWLPGWETRGGPRRDAWSNWRCGQNQPVAAVQPPRTTVRALPGRPGAAPAKQLPWSGRERALRWHICTAAVPPVGPRSEASQPAAWSVCAGGGSGGRLCSGPFRLPPSGQPLSPAPPAEQRSTGERCCFSSSTTFLPGTRPSPDVFERPNPVGHPRRGPPRRQARCQRDQALLAGWWRRPGIAPAGPASSVALACLQALPAGLPPRWRCRRGFWWQGDQRPPQQPTAAGGVGAAPSAGGWRRWPCRRLVSAGAND